MDLENAAQALFILFTGNQRSVGRWDPVTGKATTEPRAPLVQDFIAHLEGTQGVGVVPIRDDGTTSWAAIDIDNHNDTSVDLPINRIDETARDLGLPLVMCRSKSGGVHAYLFLKDRLPASYVRGVMAHWAAQLGYAGAEIFPKQSKLHRQPSGGMSLGNWINLPYMSARDTIRYAVVAEKKLSAEGFIKYTERHTATRDDLAATFMSEHRDAPPCVRSMIAGAVQEGNRNEALFATTVYLRRAFPEDYTHRAETLNQLMFDKPLARAEMSRTIVSAGRPEYSYRCGEEPLKSLCDKAACVKCRFGISSKEADNLELLQSLPVFSELIKYVTEPVRWSIRIDNHQVSNLSTAQLLDWRFIRELVAEKMLKITPMLKPQEWERILQPLMSEARMVETPDDASVSGMIRFKLKEFAQRTELTSTGQDMDDRKKLVRGLPVVQDLEGLRCVVFRAQDFIAYLKRQKSEELKGINLWFALRELGLIHTKMRAGEHNINVWAVPVKTIMEGWSEVEAPKFTTDL